MQSYDGTYPRVSWRSDPSGCQRPSTCYQLSASCHRSNRLAAGHHIGGQRAGGNARTNDHIATHVKPGRHLRALAHQRDAGVEVVGHRAVGRVVLAVTDDRVRTDLDTLVDDGALDTRAGADDRAVHDDGIAHL